jgi:hypothetical protein
MVGPGPNELTAMLCRRSSSASQVLSRSSAALVIAYSPWWRIALPWTGAVAAPEVMTKDERRRTNEQPSSFVLRPTDWTARI